MPPYDHPFRSIDLWDNRHFFVPDDAARHDKPTFLSPFHDNLRPGTLLFARELSNTAGPSGTEERIAPARQPCSGNHHVEDLDTVRFSQDPVGPLPVILIRERRKNHKSTRITRHPPVSWLHVVTRWLAEERQVIGGR